MYPFDADLDYVRNAWYVAGWSADFGAELVARRYLDEPVVVYRSTSGTPVALADRCAHRAYPLSAGTRDGDTLVCGYHGFAYDCTGKCVAIPSQPHVPAAYGVRSYPTLERAGIVWIWMGDAAGADAALLPDLTELGFTDPNFHSASGGTKFVQCRYELLNENLLDLSHIGFLHPGSIGTPHVGQFPVVTSADATVVEATRTIYNDEGTPFHAAAVGIEGRMDRTTRSVFFAPGAHVTHVTMVAPGSGAAHGTPGYFGEFKIVHLITPSSAHETYYFWAFNRTARTDETTSAYMRDAFDHVFGQDSAALERQELRLRDDPSFRELSCKADEAPLKARRLLAGMMLSEKSAPSSARFLAAASTRRTS